jgi:lactoylglutathione lyase
VTEFASLVLFSDSPDRTADFYRALGVDLSGEDHGDGHVHYATDVGGVHVAVLDADHPAAGSLGYRQAGSSFAGFYVESLESAVAALERLGAPVVVDHQVREWGCRAVVADPDGRAVEINQRDHCPPEAMGE